MELLPVLPSAGRTEILGVLQRGRYQADEQRVRPGGAGTQLRVRLGGHEEWVDVTRELGEFDQPAVRREPGEDQARLREALAVGRC